MPKRIDPVIKLFVFFLSAVTAPAAGNLADIQLFIEDEVILAPASADLDAYNVVRGPEGAIWLNTGEPKPGLFRSKDQGRTWETVPVELHQAPPGQHLAGFHAARDGSLWLLHQAPPTHTVDGKSMEYKDRRVFFSKSTDGGPDLGDLGNRLQPFRSRPPGGPLYDHGDRLVPPQLRGAVRRDRLLLPQHALPRLG